MTIAKLLKTVIDNPATQVQYLSECLIGAKTVARSKKGGGYTKVEFGTINFHPNDAVNQQGARYVGMIVWVPRDEYDRLQETDDEI